MSLTVASARVEAVLVSWLSRKETVVTQAELNRQVASVTGESVKTISGLGFVPLLPIPFERDREPLVVDWDELELRRDIRHPLAVA